MSVDWKRIAFAIASKVQSAAVSAVLAVVLLVFPWMAFPLSVLALVGTPEKGKSIAAQLVSGMMSR